jgi:phosphatidylglycerophosphatase C
MSHENTRRMDEPRVALFDLDGTLTWHDTLLPFLVGYAHRHPTRWMQLWQLPPAISRFFVMDRDRGALKSRVIQIFMRDEPRTRVETWVEAFVGAMHRKKLFRPEALAVVEAHRAAGDRLILLSASPDLYVPAIGKLLGFERTLCTEIAWRALPSGDQLDGSLITANRRGEEKSRCLEWLRGQYRGLPVIAYGNSSSDLPHLLRADQALLVNGNAGARRAAAAAGIAVGSWH